MDKLYEVLILYRDTTCQILNSIENDRFDNLKKLFSKRQECLMEIEGMKFEPEELESFFKKEDLSHIEDNIRTLIKEKEKNLIQKMNKLSDTNKAVTGYKRNENYRDLNIYNKEV